MTPREEGFLLLTSHLGNKQRKPLTIPQFRILTEAVRHADAPREDRDMNAQDLMNMGFTEPSARRIIELLSQREQLREYVRQGALAGCQPLTRVSAAYPLVLRHRLGMEAPGSLWAKGDTDLLCQAAVTLVGSRDLYPQNREFAIEVGTCAAKHGLVLVSGNARGADSLAQEACLAHGGSVISVVADKLSGLPERKNVLYLSEDGFDLGFSSQRALSRNRVIHSLGAIAFVAQCRYGTGGTWSGSRYNLEHKLTPVYCCNDGSEGVAALVMMGAKTIDTAELKNMDSLFF